MGQQEDLIQIFIAESRENIEVLDQDIVRLETEPDNRPMLDGIFRAFHTLKGNSGIVGMKRIEKVAHITEEVLTEIRDGKRAIDTEVVTFLLDSLDQLKILHHALETTGTDDAEIRDVLPPANKTKTISKKATTGKGARTTTRRTKKNATSNKDATAKKPQEDIVAEDGSWAIFSDNLPETQQAATEEQPSQTAAESGAGRPVDTQQKDVNQNWNKADSTIRVDVSLLDNLMNHVGELVLSRNQILQYSQSVDDANFNSTCERMNMITNELQEIVMKARMQPLGNIFSRFPRVIRDITLRNNKKVNLKLEGQDIELDKTIIDAIRDPLTHLVRNAIDHGIEDQQTRINCGKEPGGTLILRAYHEGGQVVLEIIDDGAGIDTERLREKAVEKSILTLEQADALSEDEAIALVFEPGLSTAEKVTKVSGRGVGMDVVKTNITSIGGRVEISSKIHQGTTIKINLPLTMSIIDGLLIRVADERYVIPLSFVLECVVLERDDCVTGRRVANVRGQIIPYIKLRESFLIARESPDVEQMVITQVGGRSVGFAVDNVIGHYQTVIKTLGKVYKDVDGISGSTILGDGSVALILDVPKLVQGAQTQEQLLHQ